MYVCMYVCTYIYMHVSKPTTLVPPSPWGESCEVRSTGHPALARLNWTTPTEADECPAVPTPWRAGAIGVTLQGEFGSTTDVRSPYFFCPVENDKMIRKRFK
jgi:hypothetical protein